MTLNSDVDHLVHDFLEVLHFVSHNQYRTVLPKLLKGLANQLLALVVDVARGLV